MKIPLHDCTGISLSLGHATVTEPLLEAIRTMRHEQSCRHAQTFWEDGRPLATVHAGSGPANLVDLRVGPADQDRLLTYVSVHAQYLYLAAQVPGEGVVTGVPYEFHSPHSNVHKQTLLSMLLLAAEQPVTRLTGRYLPEGYGFGHEDVVEITAEIGEFSFVSVLYRDALEFDALGQAVPQVHEKPYGGATPEAFMTGEYAWLRFKPAVSCYLGQPIVPWLTDDFHAFLRVPFQAVARAMPVLSEALDCGDTRTFTFRQDRDWASDFQPSDEEDPSGPVYIPGVGSLPL